MTTGNTDGNKVSNIKAARVAPGVCGIVGGRVNVFLLETGGGEMALVDTGMPGTKREVMDLLASLGRPAQAIKHILITHADLDHVGDLKALSEATGARVYASEATANFHRKGQTPPHLRFPVSIISGIMTPLMLKVGRIDQIVTDGEVLNIAGGIRVIATPGHTSDHISYFWEREKVLFAGDLFRNLGGTLTLTPEPITWSMDAARASALRVLDLSPAVMCVGHGQVWSAANSGEREQAAALYKTLKG